MLSLGDRYAVRSVSWTTRGPGTSNRLCIRTTRRQHPPTPISPEQRRVSTEASASSTSRHPDTARLATMSGITAARLQALNKLRT